MIDIVSQLQIVTILEGIALLLTCSYVLFSFLVVRQIRLLVNDIQTNLSGVVLLLGVVNVALAGLALIASLALVF